MGLLGSVRKATGAVIGTVRRSGVVDKAVDRARDLLGEVTAGAPSPRTEPWSSAVGDPFCVVEPRLFLTAGEMGKATGRKFGEGAQSVDGGCCVLTYVAGDVAVTLRAAPGAAAQPDRASMNTRASVVGSPIDWPGDWEQGVLAVAGDDAIGIVRHRSHMLEVRVLGPAAAPLVEKVHQTTWSISRWP